MTYFNNNPYREQVTAFAHDDCLPDDQFDTHDFGDGNVVRHQKWPWHWAPVWGQPRPCNYCGKNVA